MAEEVTGALRVINTAKKEIGYLEKKNLSELDDKTANAGYNNCTKYARDLDQIKWFNGKKQGFDWCSVFVSWLFVKTFGEETARSLLCQPKESLAAGVKYAAQYFKGKGQFFDGPKAGDQIFFVSGSSWTHTGIVADVKNGKVYTIEGNTSSRSGVVGNGGCVARKSYPVGAKYIGGYGRPDYSIVEDDTMTGEEIYNALQEYMNTLSVPAWAKKELEEAKSMGITDGSNPMELIPRYQAAIMAKRAAK